MNALSKKRIRTAQDIAKRVKTDVAMLESQIADFRDYNFIRLTNLYLYASYCYYELDKPFLTDGLYDKLCGYIHEHFDALGLCGVWHVGTLIVKENLKAGSCIGIEFPVIVQMVGAQISDV